MRVGSLLLLVTFLFLPGCGDDGGGPCPGGGDLLGAPPPAGTEEYCERSGVKHGPYRAWYEDGQLRREGDYDQGERCGHWTEYLPDGQVASERDHDPCPWGDSGEG